MRFSKYFCPVVKETSEDAKTVAHKLMLKAGLVRQTASGIYSFLPLGYKVLENISNVVTKELNSVGAIKMLMPTLQLSELWEKSGRYSSYGPEMLRFKDRHERELLYGPTNEEMITDIFKNNVSSYKNLPLNLYHIQWKFRDELRPRFGLMRCREFLMKDAYSFDLDEESAENSYNKMFLAYLRIFAKMGLQAIPVKADTGPIGGDLSHEFVVLANSGESDVFYDKKILDINFNNTDAENKEELAKLRQEYSNLNALTDEYLEKEQGIDISTLEQTKAVEVGHLFYFANKYSSPLGAKVLNKEGKLVDVLMGSYGIGVSRLIATLIETSHDDKGIIWHKNIAPFMVTLIPLGNASEVKEKAEEIYSTLTQNNIETLYLDQKESVGSKLNTADLLGMPYSLIIGKKFVESNIIELKDRKTGNVTELNASNYLEAIKQFVV